MSPAGIATVARQEFTIRIRAGRWRWLLISWFFVLALFTLLLRAAIGQVAETDAPDKGVVVYGGLTLLVLGLALLVVPALAAQSVNGDRERGTLATLQVTRLTAGDIAVGKLAAAWGTSLVFLAVTLPLVIYSMFLGGVPLWRVVVVTLVITLLLGSVIAISLCLSSLLSRTTTSGVLAYLIVFAFTIGTLIAFGLATALSTSSYTEPSRQVCFSKPVPPPDATEPTPLGVTQCVQQPSFQGTRTRTDRVWWLLAPNPFVVLADSAPKLPPLTAAEKQAQLSGRYVSTLRSADPLGGIGRSVRDLRFHPGEVSADAGGYSTEEGGPPPKVVKARLVWPYGLAFDVLLGAAAVWLTARRLKTPSRKLARGQRIA